MAGARRSSWEWLVTGSKRSAREEKPLEYAVHCVREGAGLEEVVEDPYVRRNFLQHEIELVMANPQLVHAARERLEVEVESGSWILGGVRDGVSLTKSSDGPKRCIRRLLERATLYASTAHFMTSPKGG
jgi:hypothetical protein